MVATFEKTMAAIVKEYFSLCQDIYHQHEEWLRNRCKTITSLQKAIQTLNSIKGLSDKCKVASAGAGIAAGALTLGSFFVPILLPAAVAATASSVGVSLGSTFGSRQCSEDEKKEFQEILENDDAQSVNLRQKMEELKK